MKKVVMLILVLFTSNHYCYSQVDSLIAKDSFKIDTIKVIKKFMERDDRNLVFNKNFYLQKSKERNIEGWVFLSIGVGLISYGLIQDKLNPCNGCFINIPAGIEYEIGGILPLLISIPFFISSYNNKQKALLFP